MDLVFGNRFRVEEQVGSGGMATVYRATDTRLKRTVAVKVLHPHLASRDDARKRFNREAQAIARLHHQNIVDVYEYSGDDEDQSYLITEFVHGLTMTDFTLAHGPFLPQSAALIGHAVAGALRHAHKEGIIHRDIKPDNLMVSRDGSIKLMDFGIATVLDMEQMTATGAILGSPAHMAPEQIDGAEVDQRVDIFAFGTLLYYLVTRRLPFMASNPHALFRKILECKYEPAGRHNAAVGRRFEEIIATCLAREPEDRFLNMESLEDALAAYLRDFQMTDTRTLLQRLLTKPEQFELEWKPALVAVLCEEGREQTQGGSLALAIDAYNRALAIDPHATEPRRGLSELTSHSRRRKQQKVAGMSAVAAIAVVVAAMGIGKLVAYAKKRPVEPVQSALAVDVPALEQPRHHVAEPAPKVEPVATTKPEAMAIPQGPPANAAQDRSADEGGNSDGARSQPSGKRPPRTARPAAAKIPKTERPGEPTKADPAAEATMVERNFGSSPSFRVNLFLDGKRIGKGSARGIQLVDGSTHTFRCEPDMEYCPNCPEFVERKIVIRATGVKVIKCHFKKWWPSMLPHG